MEKGIGDNLKSFAVVEGLICSAVGMFKLVLGIFDYRKYGAYINSTKSWYLEEAMLAAEAEANMSVGTYLLVGGVLAALILYGFGELICQVTDIANSLKSSAVKVNAVEENKENHKIVPSAWQCPACGTINVMSQTSCVNCLNIRQG